MRLSRLLSFTSAAWVACPACLAGLVACSGSQQGFAFTNDDAGPGTSGNGGSSGGGSGTGGGSTNLGGGSGASGDGGVTGDASTTVTTTIYAHTDSQLYSMNPQSKALSLIGSFTGLGGASGDDSITDLAVNAAGDVYVNSETAI